jgi:carbon monoxide dehydrogenase subunit G
MIKVKDMAEIQVSVEIDAQIDNVWDIVSDIDNEPKFWKGTKEIRNISKKDNTVSREITIAFRDQKCMQEVKLYPKEKIEALFTKGVIEGSKIITLTPKDEKTILDVKWDIKFSGMMGIFTGMIKNHIKSGTEQALQKIKEEIER